MSERNQSAEDAGAAARGAPSPSPEFIDPIPHVHGEEEGGGGGDDDTKENASACSTRKDPTPTPITPSPPISVSFSTCCLFADVGNSRKGKHLFGDEGDPSPRTRRKLILVLDLDHTLLNSAGYTELSEAERRNGFTKRAAATDPAAGLFRQHGGLTKLRPFVREFLEEASAMFEMCVCTKGARAYARSCVRMLDPDGAYFGKRIISREDSTDMMEKSLDVVAPEAERAATVVLDDLRSVWRKEHRANVILVEKYRYFAESAPRPGDLDHRGGGWRSLAEQGKDESERDGALAALLVVLRRVHGMFFGSVSGGVRSPDVRVILRKLRWQVLAGCTVAFGPVIPADDALAAEGHPVPMWTRTMAEQLGAVCAADVKATVTHVISDDGATAEARWAMQNGKFLVHRGWLFDAYFNWRRPEEHKFLRSKKYGCSLRFKLVAIINFYIKKLVQICKNISYI